MIIQKHSKRKNYNTFYLLNFIVIFLLSNLSFSQSKDVNVKMDITVRKAPEPIKQVDYKKAADELVKAFDNVELEKATRIAAKEKHYFETLNFIGEYSCSGSSPQFNQMILRGQSDASNSVKLIYSKMTSGGMDPGEYYFVINTCVNNYVDFIKKCDLINSDIDSKTKVYIQFDKFDNYQTFINTFNTFIEKYSVFYSVEWEVASKRFSRVSNQNYVVLKTTDSKAIRINVLSFYNECQKFFKEYKEL